MSRPEPGPVPRVLPDPAGPHGWFWAPDGRLRILRCTACGAYSHPPTPDCPACAGPVEPVPVSGRGRVHAFTVNHQDWTGAHPDPYVVAVVELDEQPGLRLTTNLAGCAPGDVRVGLPVRHAPVVVGDVELPLFSPAGP